MDAHQLLNALSASFFALLGIWAAVVRRHWFLRFGVVCVCLLSALFIPAYEAVIEFGLLVGVIVAGVWLARGRKNWRPQLSLETALLITVVVAVVAAVVAKLPELSYHDFAWMTVNGLAPALLALGCLWLVFGRAKLRTRLLFVGLGFVPFMAFYHFLRGVEELISSWYLWNGPPWSWENYYSGHKVVRWLQRNLPTIGTSTTIILAVLIAARGSGWFTSDDEGDPAVRRAGQLVSRAILAAIMVGVILPLTYVFYCLLNPPTFPIAQVPPSNGYDDFFAAGELVNEQSQVLFSNWQSTSTKQRRELVLGWQSTIERIEAGLEKQCVWPLQPGASLQTEKAQQTIEFLRRDGVVLACATEFEVSSGDPTRALELVLTYYHFGQVVDFTFLYGVVGYDPTILLSQVNLLLPSLDAASCRTLAKHIRKYRLGDEDSLRQVLQTKRIRNSNRNWQSHLYELLNEWSGVDVVHWEERHFRNWTAHTRLLAIQALLQAYWLESNSLPESLHELEPRNLSEVRLDPFSGEPFQYATNLDRRTYKLSSVGRDGKADVKAPNEKGYSLGSSDDIEITGPAKLKDRPKR
ncbi:hypothetical protein [Adhaeretor mobilis]|uniref:Uncharacterized protein n=1 Tax=Adhaeretor mobilis TaxID=1930276 RepID=A0A517MVC6_9BACT|nr:hypothetical protein [Adhaeretor mobilis]QDS98737.1 hypothetical protein HG15A2_20200 [Adhaeretor mobilis]